MLGFAQFCPGASCNRPLELQAFLHPRLRCTTAVLATHSATPRPNRVISKRKGADRNLDWLRYFDVVSCGCMFGMRLALSSRQACCAWHACRFGAVGAVTALL